MYSIPVWRGPAGGLEPEDRVRVDVAIETAETINARMAAATAARDQAVAAAAATDADAQAVEAGRQQAVQAAGDAAAARQAAEAARLLAEQQRQAAEAAAVAAALRAGYYDTIAAGRAAVADGETFAVRAGGTDGLARPTIYRRDSATTQTAMVTIVNPSEVDGKIDRVSQVSFGSSDVPFSVDDNQESRIFEVGADGVTRTVQLRTGGIVMDALLPIMDPTGETIGYMDADGTFSASRYALPGDSMISADVDGWAFAVLDSEGNIAGGWTEAGEFRAFGFDPGSDDEWPGQITHTVQFAFAEPHDDACTGLLVSWVTNSPNARVLQYQATGAGGWQSAVAHRSRAWPVSSTLWIHTARLTDLSPDTVYALRWMGAAFTDTVITPPRAGVRVCIASDWQRSTSGAGSLLDTFGQQMAAQDCDALIFNGDFVVDDGVWSEAMSNRWLEFMRTLLGSWRRAGSLIPIAAVLGNHEGRNAAGTSNAEAGGDGTPGPIVDIFSLGFDAEDLDYVNRSAWTFRIGREAGFVCYETNHTVTILSQLEWIDAQLEAMAPLVRHLNVVGHCGTFFARNPNGWEQYNEQARRIKRSVWPIMCKYAAKLRAYWVGHEHGVSVTPRRRTEWDESLTGAENDVRWVNDSVGGVRQLGSGMLGGATNPLPAGVASLTSSLDGSQKMEAALGWDGTTFTVHGAVNVSGAPGPYNMWIADYSASVFSARCIAQTGHQFYAIEEAV